MRFDAYLDAFQRATDVRIERVDLGNDPVEIAYAICSMMPFDTHKRQHLLETPTP